VRAPRLIDLCKKRFASPSSKAAQNMRRMCEITFNKSTTESCSVRLVSTDRQFADLSSNAEEFRPIKYGSSITTTENKMAPGAPTYEYQLTKTFEAQPSGAMVVIKCEFKGLDKMPTDFITSFERRVSAVTGGTVILNNVPAPVEYEVLPVAQ
jgi:metal-dependent hydrolase (beta-lactamase superfamily II)